MKIQILIFIIFTLISCASQDNADNHYPEHYNFLTATEPYKTVANTDKDLLSLDVYYRDDTQTKKPVVIYVHGGGWSAGDKAYKIENKVNLFQDLNYVFVSINYRLSPPPRLATADRIKYPTHNEDVADAIKWIIENIDEYGGDVQKIALMGHSAGAHLVSLTGTNARFIEDTGYNLSYIKGIASIDTEGYDVRQKVLEDNTIYINAFGTNEQDAIDASPMYNITNNSNNPIFFIAKRGSVSRMGMANAFIQKLQENNIETYEIDGSQYSHIGIDEAIGKPNEKIITPALIAFFERCFE